jgi:hypothetical protein
MNRKAILVSTLVLLTASAWAQMAPKPGPELKKFDYFLGTWTTEATIGPGPWGAGGKFTATDTTEWMPGGSMDGTNWATFMEGKATKK